MSLRPGKELLKFAPYRTPLYAFDSFSSDRTLKAGLHELDETNRILAQLCFAGLVEEDEVFSIPLSCRETKTFA